MFKIVKREEMSQGTVVLNEIEAPLIARKAKPGQFVILKGVAHITVKAREGHPPGFINSSIASGHHEIVEVSVSLEIPCGYCHELAAPGIAVSAIAGPVHYHRDNPAGKTMLSHHRCRMGMVMLDPRQREPRSFCQLFRKPR